MEETKGSTKPTKRNQVDVLTNLAGTGAGTEDEQDRIITKGQNRTASNSEKRDLMSPSGKSEDYFKEGGDDDKGDDEAHE